MNKTIRLGLSACVAVVALALNVGFASAQQKAPDAPKADAKKAVEPAKKTVTPAKKATSPCQGLSQDACTANAECRWVAETTITKGARKGQKNAAYCQKKPAAPAKKAEAKKVEPKATAPAAKAPAPKAAAPAPTAEPAKK